MAYFDANFFVVPALKITIGRYSNASIILCESPLIFNAR